MLNHFVVLLGEDNINTTMQGNHVVIDTAFGWLINLTPEAAKALYGDLGELLPALE